MEDISATVRRADEDRWLASRFASAEVRAKLEALYALNDEIARTASVVTQAAIGDIRLAWWREAIGDIYDGKPPRAHPVLASFAAVLHDTPWPRAEFEALIAARGADLDTTPFADWRAFDAYVEATAGGVMRLALTACGARVEDAFVSAGARAWGYAGLARAGRLAMAGVARADLIERARAAYVQAKAMRFETAAFPALGYVTLTPLYLRALEQQREVPLLRRQFALVLASARGRL